MKGASLVGGGSGPGRPLGWRGRWEVGQARPQVLPELDPAAAAEVAAAHQEAPAVGGALARAAYAQLISETDQIFMRLTQAPRSVRIFFTTCAMPYRDADELITSITRDRVVEITTATQARDRLHPLMGCEIGGEYDRFRAVHDILGHGLLNVGFDRDGEYAAWRSQERHHTALARRALATELHAEHSVCWTTGAMAEHKAALLDQRLIEKSRIGARPGSATGGSGRAGSGSRPTDRRGPRTPRLRSRLPRSSPDADG